MHYIATHKKQNNVKRLIEKLHNALNYIPDYTERQAIARAVCCDLLGFSTTTYMLKNPIALSDRQETLFNDILMRLKQGEPLQYIEGKTLFCGLEFAVNTSVLIPRPETAELIDWVISEHNHKSLRIIDMGTGSGCISITLSSQLPQAEVHACDISAKALDTATHNSHINGAPVTFFKHDILDLNATLPNSYDIIVSNPPYIRQHEATLMERTVTEWEPHTALFVPDNDALLFYRAIARIGQTEALHAGGYIYVEINQQLGKETMELFESFGYSDLVLRKDIYGNDRMIRCKKNH